MSRPTHTDFVEYMECHARAAQAEARMKVLRERILPHLQEGHESPRDLPYMVKLRIQERTQFDWKGALFKVLKGILRSEKKVFARMTKIESKFEVTEVPALVVVINEQYAAKDLAAT